MGKLKLGAVDYKILTLLNGHINIAAEILIGNNAVKALRGQTAASHLIITVVFSVIAELIFPGGDINAYPVHSFRNYAGGDIHLGSFIQRHHHAALNGQILSILHGEIAAAVKIIVVDNVLQFPGGRGVHLVIGGELRSRQQDIFPPQEDRRRFYTFPLRKHPE